MLGILQKIIEEGVEIVAFCDFDTNKTGAKFFTDLAPFLINFTKSIDF